MSISFFWINHVNIYLCSIGNDKVWFDGNPEMKRLVGPIKGFGPVLIFGLACLNFDWTLR